MVLLIGDEDISKVKFSPEEVIEAVESAYRQDGLGLAQDTPRREVRIKGRDLPHIAPGTTSVGDGLAYLEETGVVVLSLAFHFDWHKYLNYLMDPEDGAILAILNRGRAPFGVKSTGISVGALRTGAAAAIGAKYLGRRDVEAVGVIGTGRIGRASLLCLSKVRGFDRVYAHSGRRRDKGFAAEMGRMIGVDVVAAGSPEEVVRNSDVLVTATYATEPFVRGDWVGDGTHISGMGADGPHKAEMDAETFAKASKIAIDGVKCFQIGEMARSIEAGILRPGDIYGRIGEIVAGVKPGREDNSEITVFESDGTHIQSAAVAWLIYEKVKEAGLGVEVSRLSSFFLNP